MRILYRKNNNKKKEISNFVWWERMSTEAVESSTDKSDANSSKNDNISNGETSSTLKKEGTKSSENVIDKVCLF